MRINTQKKAVKAAFMLVEDWSKEYAIGLYLTSKLDLIRGEVISIGTLNSNMMHPREVFKPAFLSSAASVVILHNHPSGDLTPSGADKKIAKRLFKSGQILDIDLIGYIIFNLNKDLLSIENQKKGGV